MDDNVSPEPFLGERRKLRTSVQVIPSCSPKKEDMDDVEEGSSGAVKLLTSAGECAESWSTDEGEKGGAKVSDHGNGRHIRGMSFMPRHHKSEVNPFINRTMHLPWYQCVKMVITGAILLPLRLGFSIVNFLIMWFFASVVLLGLSEEDTEKSFSRWRLVFKYPICWCLRFQVFLFGFLWIRVKGKCADKEEAPIIVSNHVSPFEPFFLVSQTQATPVQRIEDSRAPIIGKIQKAMQVMFVDRSNPASKKKCLKSIDERSDPSSPFPRVLVFPEGTCTNQRALITFKHGPFMPGKPIQPVTVRYRYLCLDPSFPAVAPSLVMLALRVMCQFWNCMEIEYLPVYVPSAEDRRNPTLFAQHVQEYMSESLGVPATQHAFEDVALQFQAMKLKLNPEDAVVEWSRVRQSLDIDTDTAKEYLVVFFDMDVDRDGRLSLEEFCAPWRRKRDAAAERQRKLAAAVARRPSRSEKGRSMGKTRMRDVASLRQRKNGGELGVGDEVGMASTCGESMSPDTDVHTVNTLHFYGAHAGDDLEGGKGRGGEESDEETAADTEEEVSPGVPGMLREEEMERAYDIFCGGQELDFERFLTGLGVLSGLAREGRTGLFKLIFSVLQGRHLKHIYRKDLEDFIRRLRPDLTKKAASALLDNVENLSEGGAQGVEGEGSTFLQYEGVAKGASEGLPGGDEGAGEAAVTGEGFLAFAEQNGSIISVYQAMLLNDILGVERDIAEFGMTSGEDFGSLGVDTTELEKSLHDLVGPAALV